MLNETLEADRAYQRAQTEKYEQGFNDGYQQGVKDRAEMAPPDAIPVDWIRQQADIYPGMESAMWGKLIRLWEDWKNEKMGD